MSVFDRPIFTVTRAILMLASICANTTRIIIFPVILNRRLISNFNDRTTRYFVRRKKRTRFPLRRITRRRRRILTRTLRRRRMILSIINVTTIALSTNVSFLRGIFFRTMSVRRRNTATFPFSSTRFIISNNRTRNLFRSTRIKRRNRITSTRLRNRSNLMVGTSGNRRIFRTPCTYNLFLKFPSRGFNWCARYI